jgi:hypothetical protein
VKKEEKEEMKTLMHILGLGDLFDAKDIDMDKLIELAEVV